MNRKNILKGIGIWLASNFAITAICAGVSMLVPYKSGPLILYNMLGFVMTSLICYRIAIYGSASPPMATEGQGGERFA